jgi:hypothetical protein
LARHYPTRSRTLGVCFALATLAFAACGHSNNSTPKATVTATPVVTPNASTPPCELSLGIAFEPDAGNGNGFNGVQVSHFEGNDERTCAGVGPTATPMGVVFQSSVDLLAFDVDAEDAVAVLKGSAGYSLEQDVFGATVGQLVPAGPPYDLNAQPPTPIASSTATPVVAPLIPDDTSVSLVGNGQSAVALNVGPATDAIVALTSLTFAPPTYGLSAPFSGSTYTLPNPMPFPRTIVRVSPGATTINNTSTSIALVRGQSDLLSFGITLVGSGYQLNLEAQNTALGSGSALRGKGEIVFDPADITRALIGGTTNGGSNVLTLVDGLPTAITTVSTLALPPGANIHSIDIASNGQFAVVGTDLGIYSVNGINGALMSLVTPFSPSPLNAMASAPFYTDCNGATQRMTTVYSLGYSVGSLPGLTLDNYLVALGSASGVSCASGDNATLVAIPFSPTTGTTPAPTALPSPTATPGAGETASPPSPTPPAVFVQNNMIAPPAGSDILVVR